MVKKAVKKKKVKASPAKGRKKKTVSKPVLAAKKTAAKSVPAGKKKVSGGRSAVKGRAAKERVPAVKKAVNKRKSKNIVKKTVVKEKKTRRIPGALDKKWVGMVCIVFLALFIYSNTFQNQFMYDDTAFIVENDSIRSLENIGRFFNSLQSYSAKGDFFIYRPLSTLTFAFDYALWGLNPKQYHILNIFFHMLCGILVYLLVDELMNHRMAALLTALVFIAHPVQTESVTWIAGRSNLMFLAFYLIAFISYIRIHRMEGLKRVKYLLVSLTAYALGLLSKEMAITLPVVLVLYDFFFAEKKRFRSVFRNIKYYLLFGIVAGGYLSIRYSILGRLSGQDEWLGGSLANAFITMSRGMVHYIGLLFYPIKLSAIYVFRVSTSITGKSEMFSVAVMLLLLVMVFLLFRRSKLSSFVITWFFVTLLPVSNIIPMQDVIIAERFLYLPSIGFCIIIGLVCRKMFNITGKIHKRNAGMVLISLLVAFYSIRSIRRNTDWKDEYSFWTATVETAPDSYRVHNSLGYLYMGKNLDMAIREYELSLSLNPENLRAHNNLAIAYAEKGWYEKAIKKFRDVLRRDPYDSFTRSNIGLAYLKIGMYNNAVRECRKAVELNPSNISAYNNLGLAYEKKGRYSDALNQFKTVLENDPDNSKARANHNRVFQTLSERRMKVY